MDELFKKLKDIEVESGHTSADWDSLEKMLDKNDQKHLPWKSISAIFLMLLLPLHIGFNELIVNSNPSKEFTHTTIHSEEFNDANTNDLKSENAITTSNRSSLSFNRLSTNTNNTFIPSSILEKPLIAQTYTADKPIIKEHDKTTRLHNELAKLEATLPILGYDIEKSILGEKHIAEKSTSLKELNSDKTTIKPEVQPNSFGLEVGLKSSLINGLSNNTNQPNPWGIGAFVKLNYNIRNSFALSFDAGISSEFNQNLNYSYIAETRTFMQRSDKMVHLNTKQVYSSNLTLSAHYKWNKKLITGGGFYYNRVLQTVSEVHESGTGSFSNLTSDITRKRGYTDLLNGNEFGFCLSQTYRPNNSWGVTFSFYKGLTNRINTSYLENSNSTRTEFSLMISKRIL